jgi:hypothetical protein
VRADQFEVTREFLSQMFGAHRQSVTLAGGRRFWLHTCTKDHPVALPNYLKAGFAAYKEEVKEGG